MTELHKRLLGVCPRLSTTDYVKSSEARRRCNCFAWVAGDPSRNWYPGGSPDVSYWPADVRDDLALEAFLEAYGTLGFEPCVGGALVEGVEKIAIFVDGSGDAAHAARQLPDGLWESKMGTWEDIRHQTLDCLQGGEYGVVAAYLSRPRPAAQVDASDIGEGAEVPPVESQENEEDAGR